MIKKEINHIINTDNKKYAKYIKKAVKATLELEKVTRSYEINVELTDNEGIQKLNKTFRGKDAPTDVLSFPMNDINPENGLIILGDIVISVDKAKEQSEELNQSLERELMFLAIHSTLHLLGYDHELSEKDDMIMIEKQKEIMKYLENI